MANDREQELQSLIRMLIYTHAELERLSLDGPAAHIEACMEALSDELRPGDSQNVVRLASYRP